MPARRVKINVYDGEGNKITISFEGKVTREKVLQLLDLVEIMGGVPVSGSEEKREVANLSKIEKVQLIINKKFPVGWFSSQEVQSTYEDTFKVPIGLSTVSTYLSRLTNRGLLIQAGSVAERKYKLKRSLSVQKPIQP